MFEGLARLKEKVGIFMSSKDRGIVVKGMECCGRVVGRSAVYTEHRLGDRILPWGTPASMGWIEDKELCSC